MKTFLANREKKGQMFSPFSDLAISKLIIFQENLIVANVHFSSMSYGFMLYIEDREWEWKQKSETKDLE